MTTHATSGAPLAAPTLRLLTARTLPYFLGGFLGPFGTMLVISIYPELRDSFGVDNDAVTWSFSGYLFPMAALMLVSGTLGERYGRRRVTRLVFLIYSGASVAAALAPTIGWFVGARVVQGIGNAFITPLLLAGLVEVIPAHRTGRAVGIYSSFQAAGAAAAPLFAGLFAIVDWRGVFVLLAAVSLGLATRPAPGEPRPGAAAPPIRPLLTRRMSSLWVAALTGAAGPLGVAVLVGVYLRDELGVEAAIAGVVLAIASVCTALTGPTAGRLLDEWGARRSAIVALATALTAIVLIGLIDNIVVVTAVMIVASVTIGFCVVIIQHLAAVAVPANRGGAVSSVLSFRFAGHALGPLLLVPVVSERAELAFVLAATLGLVTLAALVVASRPAPSPGGG